MTSSTPEASVPLNTSRDLHAPGRKLDDLKRRIEALETARDRISLPVQADIDNTNSFSPSAFVEAIFRVIPVPRGFTQCNILLFVDCGQSVASGPGGYVGVQPRVDNTFTGPAISNGITAPGAVSVPSFYAVNRTGLAPGSTIRLAAWAYNAAQPGAVLTPGSCNIHLSANLLFLR